MVRVHIRIKSGDGWAAGLWCSQPCRSLAAGKYYGRPRAERPRGLPTYFSLARSLRGGKAIDMKLDDCLVLSEVHASFFRRCMCIKIETGFACVSVIAVS